MKILILGVTGMLGSATFKVLSKSGQHDVYGTLRSAAGKRNFDENFHQHLIEGVDVLDQDALARVLAFVRPEVVINCVGLIKQLSDAKDPLSALPINAMLPHRLANLCTLIDARLVHISTDCVFSGARGMYLESDVSDAEDLYGKSKYIGEVHDRPNVITLRTSIIGHELNSNYSLVDWFLSQEESVKGFRQAVFSGLPTVVLADVIQRYVLPDSSLSGLYHVSAEPIDKYTLLTFISEVYGKQIAIIPDEKLKIDRSLDSSRFRAATGFEPPAWRELIRTMFEQY
ncbi:MULTISPECIES: SDR family oxidoreductase [unclassified Pseudomonas]|uniref:dTDP-4-dehydrorhamnose reductase family protein n=1 Tax=unclassified Pseudomonas TaxID=196821 RepID=UPI00129D3AFE|nr:MULTISPECIES: SDR family oxidoreductase [unclassified Pseudomonas]MDH4656633.1 SDR family oxidoreductase [Pseudomonas sp. BN606]MRK23031.1 SDR family oxidoreductase [Pseudomonas sp. JG-B]